MKQGDRLGEGTFGIVYSATDLESDDQYAVKRNLIEKRIFGIGSLRETDVLQKLSGHPNIVQLEKISFKNPFGEECFSPLPIDDDRKSQRDDSVHFIFEKAKCDLHNFIKHWDKKGYSFYKKYMVDILLGLEYIHGKKIIHRDLKPSNILISIDDNTAKICDFGLAKPYTYQGIQSPGLVTAWYRAPEIVLDYPHYDYKSDVWSVGCIFYEMIRRKPLLDGCPDSNNSIISRILGELPTELSTQKMRSLVTSNNWGTARRLYAYSSPKKRKPFLEKLGLTNSGRECFNKTAGDLNLFCDLLNHMFEFDWEERYTTTQCLDHPFFNDYREFIMETRTYYCPMVTEIPINTITCVERKWVKEVVNSILLRKISRWFSFRPLFQAVELFDKYLITMKNAHPPNENEMESELKGLIHNKFDTILRFYVCFYMCVKYFSSLGYSFSFDEIVEKEYKTMEAKNIAEMFEAGFFVHGLKYDVYDTTIYEIADVYDNFLTNEQAENLLLARINDNEICNMLPSQLYQKYMASS